MADELYQVRSLKNSFQLIEPPTITNSQQGELHALVANKARSSGKFNAYFWTRFLNHFKLSSYKLLPADRFQDALEFLRKLEGDAVDSFMMLTKKELASLMNENYQSANDGEIFANENSITLKLKPWVKGDKLQRWLIMKCQDLLTFHTLDDDQEVMTKEIFIRQLKHDDYIVMKKDDFLKKLQQ
jgi:hypothetical protein